MRDLLRGTTGLPSGEELARFIGVPLTVDTWPDGTPLWFYILKVPSISGAETSRPGRRPDRCGGPDPDYSRAGQAYRLSLEPDGADPARRWAGLDLTDLLIPADSN